MYSSVTILLIVWKANSTMASSLSDAAEKIKVNREKYQQANIEAEMQRNSITTQEKYAKYILPSGFDLVGLTVDHLRDTANHHIADSRWTIAFHNMLERPVATAALQTKINQSVHPFISSITSNWRSNYNNRVRLNFSISSIWMINSIQSRAFTSGNPFGT